MDIDLEFNIKQPRINNSAYFLTIVLSPVKYFCRLSNEP